MSLRLVPDEPFCPRCQPSRKAQSLAQHIALSKSTVLIGIVNVLNFEAVNKKGRAVSVSNSFVGLLAQAGLRECHSHEGHGIGRDANRSATALSFHSLRHTAVTLLKDAGIPQAAVQELIGHESEPTANLTSSRTTTLTLHGGTFDVAPLDDADPDWHNRRGRGATPILRPSIPTCEPKPTACGDPPAVVW
jgi:hypothetical protein